MQAQSMKDGSSPKTEPAEEAKIPHHVFVDGVLFPIGFETGTKRPMKEHVDCLKALEMREDDVIICAFQKCGTHWLWEIAFMLLSGKAEYEKRAKEFFMMDAVDIESIQSQSSPRILNTHVPTQMLPAQIKDKKTKIIHVYRNPKDVVVSYYSFLKGTPKFKDITEFDLEAMLQAFITTKGKAGYVSFLQSMAKFMEDNPDHPVFNVSFEEIKEDHVGTVRRLGEFLGVKTTPELCAEIALATGFDKMKQANSNKIQKGPGKDRHYRKGVVGDWKNHLTVAQSEAVDARMKELEGCDKFRFRYTP